jgi:hypothetical protein
MTPSSFPGHEVDAASGSNSAIARDFIAGLILYTLDKTECSGARFVITRQEAIAKEAPILHHVSHYANRKTRD